MKKNEEMRHFVTFNCTPRDLNSRRLYTKQDRNNCFIHTYIHPFIHSFSSIIQNTRIHSFNHSLIQYLKVTIHNFIEIY